MARRSAGQIMPVDGRRFRRGSASRLADAGDISPMPMALGNLSATQLRIDGEYLVIAHYFWRQLSCLGPAGDISAFHVAHGLHGRFVSAH